MSDLGPRPEWPAHFMPFFATALLFKALLILADFVDVRVSDCGFTTAPGLAAGVIGFVEVVVVVVVVGS